MNIEDYAIKYKHLKGIEAPTKLKELLNNSNWETYADLGCGGGAFLFALNKLNYFTNKKVYAIDLSSIRLKSVKEINPEFNTIVADITNIENLNDNEIDFITTNQVIEHVDDEKMLNELYRILKKNGTIYLTTVFKKRFAWYFYKNSKGQSVLDPTHLREYTKDSQLLDIIQSVGFDVVYNKKNILSYSLLNFIIKKLKLSDKLKLKFNWLDKFLKIPIPGYFIWEIVLKK